MNRPSMLVALGVAALSLSLAGCPKGLPGVGGGGGAVDPNSCSGYDAAGEVGLKVKAFLGATAQLDAKVRETEAIVKNSCIIMGKELQMAPGDLEGDTKSVCTRVINTIDENMKVAIKADAKLNVEYKPAVCTVDAQASAKAAAECEAKAEADVSVTCEGTCSGTCKGECEGTAGTGGSEGQCNGVCKGSCEGSCEGNAEVEASAECKASAEVKASVEVQCTEPELKIEAEASAVVDASKAEMTLKALRTGLPKILSVKARLKPLQAAIKGWAATAKDLAKSAKDIGQKFGNQVLCISGQLTAAAGMVAGLTASVDVQVEVSVSASASAGVE